MTEFYFLGSDACSSMVGHLNGAIAYIRRELDQQLIFVIRCMAHITGRTLRHMLNKLNSKAGRAGLKRKSAEPSIDREILLMEDMAYLLKKWEALRAKAQSLQPEPVRKIRGCINTRFEYSAHALRLIVGLTLVCDRLWAIWERLLEADPPLPSALGQVVLATAQRVVAEDPWHADKFDFADAPHLLSFTDLLDAYIGPLILPQLDLVGVWLNSEELSFEELQEEGVAIRPPEGCPLPSEGSLAQKLPNFLLDVGDVRLRIDCAISEVPCSSPPPPRAASDARCRRRRALPPPPLHAHVYPVMPPLGHRPRALHAALALRRAAPAWHLLRGA